MPLALVLVMIFAPRGILGLRELRWFVPKRDLEAHRGGAENESKHELPHSH